MNTKDKILFELQLKELITNENTTAATELKYKFILDLINNSIEYINCINYYYNITELNTKKE